MPSLPYGGALAALGVLLVVAAWLAPAARTEVTTTAQAQTTNAAFLATSVPPGQAAGICLVDTGPDTSHVVDRVALLGDDVGDISPAKRGSRLAMIMGAGLNGFGIVGLFASVRVVSVRATIPGSDRVIMPGYVNAIKRCNDGAASQGLRVIELAPTLSGPLGADEGTHLTAATRARARTDSASCGGRQQRCGPPGTAASQPGVLSVGGSAADGQRCVDSAAGAVLQAPGCELEDADPATGQPPTGWSGTSPASALAAAALAALRSWRPELSVTEAEQALVESARPAPGGPLIDVAAAFRRLGLSAVVDANQPASPAATLLRHHRAAPRPGGRLPAHGAIRRYRGVLVSVRNRPPVMVTVVSVHRLDAAVGRLRQVASRARGSGHIALRVTRWGELRVRVRDTTEARTTRPVTIVVHSRHRNAA